MNLIVCKVDPPPLPVGGRYLRTYGEAQFPLTSHLMRFMQSVHNYNCQIVHILQAYQEDCNLRENLLTCLLSYG